MTQTEAIAVLRAAGCVFPEEEWAEISRAWTDPVDRAQAVRERASGMPLEQVVRSAEFGAIRVSLAPGVFVPRRRAEAIVDEAVRSCPDARIVVDLGCGAGALAAALGRVLPDAEVHGVDIDEDALACARITSKGTFAVHLGDWWAGLPAPLKGRVDLAMAYLPHVPDAHLDDIHPDFRNHEPTRSVAGGPDGLDHLRTIAREAAHYLASGGALVTLISADQLGTATRVLQGTGFTTVSSECGDDDVVITARLMSSRLGR